MRIPWLVRKLQKKSKKSEIIHVLGFTQ
jgi:hypothetical protein